MVPPFTLDAGLEWNGAKNSFRLAGQLTSRYYTDSDNAGYVDGHFVANAGYARTISKNFSISLDVDNLFNESYETVEGYIMPPLRIRTGVEAEF
jgi:outer membrane receptor protein involved in Fe transport